MSGQLVMLPSSIRICIKSHELSPHPIHGDSMSCRVKAMLERVLLIKSQYGGLRNHTRGIHCRLLERQIYSQDLSTWVFAICIMSVIATGIGN